MRRVSVLAVLLTVVCSANSDARCGKERWPVKTGTYADARLVNPNAPVRSSIAELIAFDEPNTRPQDARVQPVETTVYDVNATLTAYKWENSSKSGDNDYHLVLADENGQTLIAEIPSPQC